MAKTKRAKAKKTKVKKTKTAETGIEIAPIQLSEANITIQGVSPLIVNKFSEKSKQEILDKQMKKGKAARAARDPIAEYKASLYTFGKGKYGVPAAGLKLAAISACRYVDGIKMTQALGAFHVIADHGSLVQVKGKPVMDEQTVRVGGFGNKVPMQRFRGRFDKWQITFKVRYNRNVITPSQLLNLYENAGFSVGLCEYRPEKKGSFGMFKVKRSA